jgi:lysophospholipid acyltransferase (LPLAT)-like uncharacterized protein
MVMNIQEFNPDVRKKKDLGTLQPTHLPFLPPMIAWTIRLLHWSCRFTVLGRENLEATFGSGVPVLPTTWHFAFPAIIYFFRNLDGVVMVSRSLDGEWIARVLHYLGYHTARGSPGKGGMTALREMLSYIQAGHHAGLIADGSQGPPCIAQNGILLLARYSGAPLLPVSMAAHPCWRFRSWDRTMLAKPFSRVILAVGSPFRVSREVSAQELEKARKDLENRLNELTQRAWAALK